MSACHAEGHGFESRTSRNKDGELAQLARASALHAEGHRFESDILHTVAYISWLDSDPDKIEVASSSLAATTFFKSLIFCLNHSRLLIFKKNKTINVNVSILPCTR
jgi:hypothetical protein